LTSPTRAEEQNECELDDAYADGSGDAEAQNEFEREDACANEPEGSEERDEFDFRRRATTMKASPPFGCEGGKVRISSRVAGIPGAPSGRNE
jgi:hypothetical protein